MTTLFFVIASLIGQSPQGASVGRALHAEYLALIQDERAALNALADRLAGSGKEEAAAVARGLVEPVAPAGRTRFIPLPEVVPNLKPEERTKIPEEVRLIREKTAKALFELAGKAASKTVRRLSIADRSLRGVLARDANHAEARRLLGYVSYDGGWATPHAVGLLKTGYVLHSKYGWVLADWVAKLDEGQLPSDFDASGKAKSWVPAEEANLLHRDWQSAWTIETAPHFRIESNVDLAEAVAFAQRLEAFYQLFMSEFADLIGPDHLPLIQRFDNKKSKPIATPKRFLVSYFANKSQYVEYLKFKYGRDESVSLGYYLPRQEANRNIKPMSFFYKDDTNPIAAHSTLYHEASHQILFETAGRSNYESNNSNYWVWEGLGTYFETVEPQEDGSILVGGLIGPRIAEARVRILERGEYIPLNKFTEMGEAKFREDGNQAVIRNYQEAMALTSFLLHGEDGTYREAFLDFVVNAYRGKNIRRSSLSDKLGKPFKSLDEQFLNYLKKP